MPRAGHCTRLSLAVPDTHGAADALRWAPQSRAHRHRALVVALRWASRVARWPRRRRRGCAPVRTGHTPLPPPLASRSRAVRLWRRHGRGGGFSVGPGYTRPPPVVGRPNVLQACRARGQWRGGWRRGLGGALGGAFCGLATLGEGGGGKRPRFTGPLRGGQPTACTLALWWLDFGPTGGRVAR